MSLNPLDSKTLASFHSFIEFFLLIRPELPKRLITLPIATTSKEITRSSTSDEKLDFYISTMICILRKALIEFKKGIN